MKQIVISLTNDIRNDRRMLRTGNTLTDSGYQIEFVCRKLVNISTSNTFPTHYINCWFSKGWVFYLEFNIRLFWKLIFIPTDILLSVDSDTLLANTLVRVLRQKPLVIDMHELFTEVPELEGHGLKKWLWKRIESFGIKRSTRRYTVSQTIAKQYQTLYSKSFEVIRNVPSKMSDQQIHKRDRFTLVYLGALNKGRGIEMLFGAIRSLPDVELLILGEGDLSKDLRALSDKLNIQSQVSFQGWISQEEIPTLLSSAHVGINLLDPSSKSYYLSLANKYFDYIHAGIPIITMDFPEYIELNQQFETSVLINQLHVEDISRAINSLKSNPILYNRLQSNCSPASQLWNWEFESKKLLSIFDF